MGFRRVFRVNYLGTIRNRPGDSHGQGGRPVRPRPRHAQLVVNLAGAMSTYLLTTWVEQDERSRKPPRSESGGPRRCE
ncbi:MAG: abortive infection family protein [Microvirga sp.]